MKKSTAFSKMWFLLVLLVAFVAGCGGNDSPTPSSDKAVSAYSVAGSTGTVDESSKTIAVAMPYGTNVTSQVATFTTTGSGVTVGTVAQASGTTANNFTGPLVYTVTAADGTTATYTVTVTVGLIGDKAITSYSLDGVPGTINETAKTIAVTMPNGRSVTALVASFTTTAAGVKVGTVVQKSGTTVNSFTGPVSYTATAADNSTATYTVTVTVALVTDKAITSFTLGGVAGTINETAKTIAVTMPYGKNVTALAAAFTTSGSVVKVGTTVQTSGVTTNSFTAPVTYTVTAADNTTAAYTVTVTVAANPAKAITAYSLAGVAGTVNETSKTISVTLPSGTSLLNRIATFTTTGAVVKVGAAAQTSGVTANTFTTPVIYTVTAADATTAAYTVTVTLAAAKGPAPVLLGAAGNYVILATSGVSTVPASVVTGDIGLSPAATSFLTGFSLTMVGTTAATSPQVTGNLYGADMSPPTSTNLTTAVTNMGTAYTDAAGRPTPDVLNLGAGEIGGQTLIPGLYKWTTGVTASSDVTVSGGPNDIWIFQIPGNLLLSPARRIFLSGGAQARNIFWQVAGAVSIGTTAHFEGVILSQTSITMGTGSSINGRLLAQTAVILDTSTVTTP